VIRDRKYYNITFSSSLLFLFGIIFTYAFRLFFGSDPREFAALSSVNIFAGGGGGGVGGGGGGGGTAVGARGPSASDAVAANRPNRLSA